MSTQPQLENLIDIEEQYQVATYKTFPFVIERGDDVWVHTTDGGRYLDLWRARGRLDRTFTSASRQVDSRITKLILLVEQDRRMVDDGLCSHRPSGFVECVLD